MPIRIALIDDYDVVLAGVANMLAPYRDRVVVVELDANEPLDVSVDIALYDSFAQSDTAQHLETLISGGRARRVVVYTWAFHPDAIHHARRLGVSGYLSKTLPARGLVEALEAVDAGHVVISDTPPLTKRPTTGLNWPGRGEGLTDREAEVLALITQGRSNSEIAAAMYLSPNTLKTYIRNLYRKIGAGSRTQAVLWGTSHGFSPDHDRIRLWSAATGH